MIIRLNRDGKKCRPGKYKLLSQDIDWAQQVLKENAVSLAATEPTVKVVDNLTACSNSNIGELVCQ